MTDWVDTELAPDFRAAIEFRETLNAETDRGCALMAAAYLDDRLEELLKAYFAVDQGVAEKLLEQSHPLGTFSARIDAAYALGLLSKNTKHCTLSEKSEMNLAMWLSRSHSGTRS